MAYIGTTLSEFLNFQKGYSVSACEFCELIHSSYSVKHQLLKTFIRNTSSRNSTRKEIHCKIDFFRSGFSHNRAAYEDLLRKSPYSVQPWENMDQEKPCVWTLVSQWYLLATILESSAPVTVVLMTLLQCHGCIWDPIMHLRPIFFAKIVNT